MGVLVGGVVGCAGGDFGGVLVFLLCRFIGGCLVVLSLYGRLIVWVIAIQAGICYNVVFDILFRRSYAGVYD